MPDPGSVGARVLAALERGRQRAIDAARARAAVLERAVRRALDVDVLEGRPDRGRPGRIARRLTRAGLPVSRRHVARILVALSCMSDSTRHAAAIVHDKDRAA